MEKKPRFVRKHFFINRKLQGRYMLSFLIPMLLLLCFMLFTVYAASHAIISTTTRILKRDIESITVLSLQDQANPSAEQYEKTIHSITNYIRTFSTNKEYKHDVLASLLWVFGIGLLLVIIQLVLLTIFFSHKVAGPVFRFEKVCNNIIDGDYTDEIRLRKGDEMQNLAKIFNEALTVTRTRLNALRNTSDSEDKEKISSTLKI